MYLAGLTSGMSAYMRGDMHLIESSHESTSPLVMAFDQGFEDADDDSDDPRPDDPAALQAMARAVFAELERIGADVSAWPDYARGQLCLDDGLTSERHDPETLLATLRGLPAGAGAVAMWQVTAPIALACLTWNACPVVTEQSAAPAAYSL
jgi:hypothetical protein